MLIMTSNFLHESTPDPLPVGEPGDVVVMRSSLQHCAVGNNSKDEGDIRSGIILHFGPAFIRPYEDIAGSVNQDLRERACRKLRKVCGLDNAFPRKKVGL